MLIHKKDDKLVVEIPLKQKITNSYEEGDLGETDNLIGVICGYEQGFAQLIDMSYKDKDPQIGGIIVNTYYSEEDFIELCKKLGIGFYKYPLCAKCNRPIFGTGTFSKNGFVCMDCE